MDSTRLQTFFVRSIFLQGLLIQKKIPKKFNKFSPYLKKLETICNKNNINKVELLINFLKNQKKIKNFIFGVNSINQLKEIVREVKSKRIIKIDYRKISSNKINFIDPRVW